ncbi:MAG TPA: thiamine biosynthesis protein ThiS [Deltaproteobacteria bacterium]|nr:MAG: thiamine biosynthesis protein ThiS [Deltaproteobacteria bacterium GWA2_55_82]OGQ62588.1 MAG: thiamine biosynthesis protein ThiS [Deltaproteobacteria bacterium RIFCSPLOWO2_02_FULL_55_12]OIJ74177.1 MAG: thiamine biosynthesis protein ThiS [Deltaproteobacteria bacterium GWC2_55_46]HBG46799.1 thiamine biosynthesis protein ThiS [Deltaproteobacteria bacterium]HCY11192.1 thiamine biosynthesis protein ThiS [Deltaproteobacteria bacterium]
MKIKINGEDREAQEGSTVEALLESLSIKREGIAVDLNREIVPRRLLGSTVLKEGDTLEIVRMVGGG